MIVDPPKRRRRSIRLKEFDYSQAGAYFVTICAHCRRCLFGEIENGEMTLNEVGAMVQSVWYDLPQYYSGIDIDELVIMPNHLHGIIFIKPSSESVVGAGPRACPFRFVFLGQARGPAPTRMSLPIAVHRFKSLTTARYRQGIGEHGWKPFQGKLWQRNYYEHVVRNNEELNRVRQYIIDNPLCWESDPENPSAEKVEAKKPWEL